MLLGILSVTPESLTQSHLLEFTGLSEQVLWTYLGKLQQFIEKVDISENEKESVYRLYHQSFIDFFHRQSLKIRDKRLRNSYYLPPEEWHKRIVQYYHAENKPWNKVDWIKVNDYGLLHLATHLYALRDVQFDNTSPYRQELYALICKPFMQEKLARLGSHQSFSHDVTLAIMMADAEDPPNIVQIIRTSLIYAILVSLATKVAPETLGALAQLGQFERAIGYADLIQDAKKRSHAYLLIAEALIKQGDRNSVQFILKKTLESAHFVEEEDEKSTILSELVQALVKTGEQQWAIDVAEQAAVLAEENTFENIKADVFLESARAVALTQRYDRVQGLAMNALTVIENIAKDNIDRKAATLFKIGNILELVGNPNEARNITDRAWGYITQINEDIKRGDHIYLWYLLNLVRSMIELKNFDWASAISLKWMDGWDKATALSELSQALIDKDRSQAIDTANQALKVIEDIYKNGYWDSSFDKDKRKKAITSITTTLAKLQNFEKAVEIAESAKDIESKGTALGNIAHSLISINKFQTATEIVDRALVITGHRLENISPEINMLCSISQELAKAGMKERALKLAQKAAFKVKSLSDKDINKKEALNMVIQAFSAVKDFQGCLIVAESIKDNSEKVKFLSVVACLFADAGKKERAVSLGQKIIKLAKELQQPSEQAAIFGKLAKMFSDLGIKKEASELGIEVINISKGLKKPIFGTSEQNSIIDALSTSSQAFARIGQYTKAMEVAESITEQVDSSSWILQKKAETLKILVEELVKAEKVDFAVEVTNKIVEIAKNRDNVIEKGDMGELSSIAAQALFAVGLSEKAMEFTNSALSTIEANMGITKGKKGI
jgi:tetratricopeptide (TPR) repeat protein